MSIQLWAYFLSFFGRKPCNMYRSTKTRAESISRKGYSSSRVKDVTETPGWFSVIQQFSNQVTQVISYWETDILLD